MTHVVSHPSVDDPTAVAGTAENKASLVGMVPPSSGTPDEIAEAILFPASAKAAFITGATLAAGRRHDRRLGVWGRGEHADVQ
jgi:NAD(P)-dependent dehydrogenase (short-subunit alcohol dehydrogenase family)